MNFVKIKTDWASLRLTEKGPAIVCARTGESVRCTCFDSLSALRDNLSRGKISVKKWAVSVPDDLCIVKSLQLPASDLKEAFRMLEFELASLIPIPQESLLYGCTFLGKRDNFVQIQVYIMKQNTLKGVMEAYGKIGIKPNKVMVDSASIQRWYQPNGERRDSAVSILFGNENCNIKTIIDENNRIFENSKNDGNGTAPEPNSLIQTIHYYTDGLSNYADKKIDINITAPKGNISKLQSFFNDNKEDFAGRISFFEYPEVVFYGDETKFKIDELRCDTIAAEGLLLSATDNRFEYLNLLPRSHIKKTQQKSLIMNFAITI